MKYELILIYSEALIRQAVFRFWWRTVGPVFFAVLIMLSALFCFLLVVNVSGWTLGLLGGVLAFAISFIVLIYVVHYKRSMGRFRSMVSPETSFKISEETLSFSSCLGDQFLQWSAVSEVWVFENMWLFLYSKSQFSTIPLRNIPQDAKGYILSKIKAAGGKIN